MVRHAVLLTVAVGMPWLTAGDSGRLAAGWALTAGALAYSVAAHRHLRRHARLPARVGWLDPVWLAAFALVVPGAWEMAALAAIAMLAMIAAAFGRRVVTGAGAATLAAFALAAWLNPMPPRARDLAAMLLVGFPVVIWLGHFADRQGLLEQHLRTMARGASETLERERRALRAARAAVWEWSFDSGHVYRSETAGSLLGTGAEGYSGTTEDFLRLVHPDDRHLLEEATSDVRHGRHSFDTEFRILRPDGQVRWIRTVGEARLDAAGEAVGMSGVDVDVTERRAALEALLEREEEARRLSERLAALIAAAPVPVVELDGSWRIRRWNGAAEHLYGWALEEVAGKHPPYVDPVERERRRELQARVEAGESVQGHLMTHLTKTGERKLVEVSVAPVHTADAQTFMAVHVDATERLRLVGAEEQSGKMEALGRLAGAVAHDFNNLLTVMRGSLDLVQEAADRPSSSRHLADVEHAVDRAADLVDQLMSFTRPDPAGEVATDLSGVVREAEPLLRRLAGSSVQLDVRTCPTPCWVAVRPGRVNQLLMNLAANARDAMPRGGLLTVDTQVEHLEDAPAAGGGERPAGRYGLLTVRDTGVGMDEATRRRLFEPFFTTKQAGAGTGLGLATVREITETAGGFIHIQSSPGAGTTVHVAFPLTEEPAPAAAAPPARPAPPAPSGAGETVLLVEDDDAIRELVSGALARQNYEVLTAADGAEALAVAAEQRVDVLVSDVNVPGLRGPEIVAMLRGDNAGLPVVLVSGYPRRLGPAEERTWFLAKPFRLAAFLAVVGEAAAASRQQ